jgi:hypothetical protein
MRLTGKIRSTWINICPSVALSTAYTTWAGLKSTPALRCERPGTNPLKYAAGHSVISWDVITASYVVFHCVPFGTRTVQISVSHTHNTCMFPA